jgi:predicted TIM-barrel fold metal-dependent hydrolase
VDTSHAAVGDIVAAVSVAGADRVLFGSDAAVHGLEHAQRTASLLTELQEALPSDQYTRLVGKNAAQVFRLSPPARNS